MVLCVSSVNGVCFCRRFPVDLSPVFPLAHQTVRTLCRQSVYHQNLSLASPFHTISACKSPNRPDFQSAVFSELPSAVREGIETLGWHTVCCQWPRSPPPHCKAEKESQRIGRPTPSSTHFSLISLECFLFLVESRREHHVLEWHEWHETFKSSADGISIKSYNVTFVV